MILLLSVIIGCVLAVLTGWLILIVVLPALAIGLPYLLILPKARDVELLEALDRWVRSLAATLATGKSITDAIRISRRTAPPLIADEISLLVTRLNNRWETRDALMRFADALDSPDADAVIAALILASSRGANGASVTLKALADSIQAQLKGRRAIEVERSKPYVVVRQVTVISLSTLILVFLFSPDFFAPYRTPLGQALLSLLLIMYIASLILMRRKAHQPSDHASFSGTPMTVTLVLLSGILLAAGMSCLVVAFARSTPQLDAALERIGADGTHQMPSGDIGPVRSRSERLGAFVYRVMPIPLTNGQRRALRLLDKPIAEFYADKAVMAIIGTVLPGLAGLCVRIPDRSPQPDPCDRRCGWWRDRLLRPRPAASSSHHQRFGPEPRRPCWSTSIWLPWSG